MQKDEIRAIRNYRDLAQQMRRLAKREISRMKQNELLVAASEYEQLALNLGSDGLLDRQTAPDR